MNGRMSAVSARALMCSAVFTLSLLICAAPSHAAFDRSGNIWTSSLGPTNIFPANPGSLGAIPDHAGSCHVGPFNTGRSVTFNVSGLTGVVSHVEVSMRFGSPVHTFAGDITALLIAPNGASHVVFGRTGATTTNGSGDSSDLAGPYLFSDAATLPPNGGWWQTAALRTDAEAINIGEYRTTATGGAGATNPMPPTNMDSAFSGITNPNGTWTLRLTDGCTGDTGSVSAASLTVFTPSGPRPRADFDGDGRSDLSVFRPSEGNWYLNKTTAGFSVVNWGLSTDIPTPEDFDGDNKADTAIFRPSTGTWWIVQSGGGLKSVQFGLAGDIPVAGDYDGDGASDIAVFRPSNNVWYIRFDAGGEAVVSWGAAGDIPVRGDYNGDEATDIVVYRPSSGQWWALLSGGGSGAITFGNSTDKPVPADYDGDNKDDIAIYRPSSGQWWILSTLNGTVTASAFGLSSDIPVPGDYDGDGRDDIAVYRNGVWWVNGSTSGVTASSFGLSSDVPIPSKYLP